MALDLPPRRREALALDPGLAVVNIVLLLIFFFMAVGQRGPADPGVALSVTQGLPLEALPQPVLVVRGPGDWQLDGQPVSPELIAAAVPGPVLHVMMDRTAPASLLVETLRSPALAGYDLRLVTLSAGAAP